MNKALVFNKNGLFTKRQTQGIISILTIYETIKIRFNYLDLLFQKVVIHFLLSVP